MTQPCNLLTVSRNALRISTRPAQQPWRRNSVTSITSTRHAERTSKKHTLHGRRAEIQHEHRETRVQRRRDQNRISQRAFRLRKEKHARELESKVEELETLLETSSYENTIAASRMYIIEAELSYYRGLLFVSSPNASKGSYITSYRGSDYQPSSNQFSARGGDRGSHDTIPYVHAPAMASTVPPVLGDGYQRAGSYDSSSTGTHSLALDTPVDSFWSPNYLTASLPQRDPDGSAWSTYLVFNTEEPVLDNRIFKD